MTKLSRRNVVAFGLGSGAAAGFLRFPADAAEYTFKFGLASPMTNPITVQALAMARRVQTESHGRMEVQVFPANALGDDTAMMAQLRTGAIQLYASIGSILASLVPLAGLEGIAFAFSSYDQIFKAWDGALGNAIRTAVRNTGLYTFDKVWMYGYLNFMNSRRPIATPKDFEGLKIRVSPAATEIATFKALGASIVPLTGAEVPTSMQTHLIDGFVTSLAVVEGFKWYELIKYVTLTQHSFASATMLANNDAMQGLPKDMQTLLNGSMNAAASAERAQIVQLDQQLEKTLQTQGVAVNKPALAPFRAAIRQAKLYDQWRAQYGPQVWALLENYSGKLT